MKLPLPPVDAQYNAPDSVDRQAFRERYDIKVGDLTLVTVSRLVDWMNAESLRRTVDVVRTLGRDLPLRFVIVGDGTSRAGLERLRGQPNRELRREPAALTRAPTDPRPPHP